VGDFRPFNASVALPVVAMSVGSAVLVTVDIKPDRVDDFLKVGTKDGEICNTLPEYFRDIRIS